MKSIEVLLIEDNSGDILLIRQTLAHEPFPVKVRVAMDGKQAMQILADRNVEPDLIILDLDIPKISGLSLLECNHVTKPVVVFTSSSRAQDRQCAFELGAKEFVQKPSDLDEFARQVSRIVRDWGKPELAPSA